MRNYIGDVFAAMKKSRPVVKADTEEKNTDRELAAGAWVDELRNDILENPATLIKRKGLEIIDEMLEDDAIGAFMRMKKEARLSTDFNIEAASDSTEDMAIAEFIRYALFEYVDNNFRDVLRHMYSALEYGYSLHEKVLTLIPDGPHAGKLAYSHIIPQRPHAYRFKMDKGKQLATDGIVNIGAYGRETALPTAKFIHYAYNSDWGNPFGKSDVSRAYPWWVVKKYGRRFWAIYLERLAGGFIDASFTSAVSAAERENLKKVIDTLSAKTSIMHPDTVTINVKESNGTGGVNFERSTNAFNIYMARTVLVPDLLGFSSAGSTGSYALGKKHFDVFLWVLKAMGQDGTRIIQEQIIKPLVIMNYGADVPCPRFTFEPLTMNDKLEILTSYYTAVEKGVVIPTDEDREWVLKTLTMPHSERPEEQERKTPGWGDEQKQKEGEAAAKKSEPDKEEPENDEASGGLTRKLNKHELKVDYASIQATFDNLETNVIEQWRQVAIEQRDNLLSVARGFIERRSAKGIEDVRLIKVGTIDALLRDAFCTAYLNARYEAGREIKDAMAETFSFDTFASAILLEPVPPAEALAHFTAKGLQIARAALVPYTQKAFIVAGVERAKILAEVKAAILKGIQNGDRATTEKTIKKIFDGYVETGEIRDGELSTAYRVENVVRTNMAEAYGAGRQDAFNDPDVRDYIEAFEISAVLDSGTTDNCEGADGAVVTREDLDAFGWPPWHYECRTIAVPIVRGESFTITGFPAGTRNQFKGGGKVR
jgi:SPP1 gp7 family putative phage head morphogenesis protein